MKNKLNRYNCKRCGFSILTKDVDEGTTPMLTQCPICKDWAQSSFYQVNKEDKEEDAIAEWYKPDTKDYESSTLCDSEYPLSGALVLRYIKELKGLGRTTKLADKYINELFQKGEITVIDHYDTFDSNNRLADIIARRLSIEHGLLHPEGFLRNNNSIKLIKK